jgi:uncharacterized membrane protein YeaQ/YmgE (transglycosylase-associated protein family)
MSAEGRPPFPMHGTNMHMSNEGLLIILMVGLIAGWLAGQIVQGTGIGIIGDLLIGIIGAFIGSWLLPQLGIHLGLGIVAAIVNATIGALVQLLIIRLIRGGGGWRGSWGKTLVDGRLVRRASVNAFWEGRDGSAELARAPRGEPPAFRRRGGSASTRPLDESALAPK